LGNYGLEAPVASTDTKIQKYLHTKDTREFKLKEGLTRSQTPKDTKVSMMKLRHVIID